jgi:hypothetical protein
LPPALLLQLIRMGEEPLADFLGRYTSWALDVYLQTRSGLGSLFNPFAASRPFPPPAPAAAPAAQDELKALRREMAELRRSIKDTAKSSPRPGSRPRRKR